MQPYSSSIDTVGGSALRNASVAVKLNGELATIYALDGTPQDNPMTTDSTGSFSFRAANGEYTLEISRVGIVPRTETVLLYDPEDDPAPAELAASGGAALVGAIQSGTGAVARTVQDKLRDIVSVKDFGAVGDGVADDTAAIQAAADHAANVGALLRGAPGTYIISETLALNCSGDLSDMTVNADAAAVAVAVRVGPNTAGQYLFDADLKLPFVMNTAKTGAGWAGFDSTIGVEIANVYQSRITVPSVYNFGVGLKEGGYGAGCVYNTITIGVLYGNKVNHRLQPGDAAGWVNQNTHIGGRFAYSNIEGTAVAGVVQIQTRSFNSVTNNVPDTNVWINPSVEGNEPAVHLDIQGRLNTFQSPRLETFAPTLAKINWHADSAIQTNSNLLIGGYVYGVTYSYSGAGTSQHNQWIGRRAGNVRDFSGSGENLRNTSGDNVSYPHMQGFPSGVDHSAKDQSSTDWTYRIFGQGFAIKQTGDAFARVLLGSPGYIFFGSGSAAPTAGMRYNVTPQAITSDTHFAPDADSTLTNGTSNRRWAYVHAINVKTHGVNVANLPAAATAGAGTRAFVLDATATTFASIVAGGGANGVPVYCDGANWRIG